MSVHVSIIDGPLPDSPSARRPIEPSDETGAELTFVGIVRRDENGRTLIALDYEAYLPMAQTTLESLARDVVQTHALLSLSVEHSRGVVPVGAASLRVTVLSRHRAEGLAAMSEFISRLKQDVPIWKKPVWR